MQNHASMSDSEKEHLTKFFYDHHPDRVKYFESFDPVNVTSETYLLDTREDLLMIKRALAEQ